MGAIAQHIAAAQREADEPDLARQSVRQAQRLRDGIAQSLVLLSGPIVRIEQHHIVAEVGDPAGDVAIVRYAGRARSHDHDATLAGGWRVFFLRARAMRRRQGQKRRGNGDAVSKASGLSAPPFAVSAAAQLMRSAARLGIEQAGVRVSTGKSRAGRAAAGRRAPRGRAVARRRSVSTIVSAPVGSLTDLGLEPGGGKSAGAGRVGDAFGPEAEEDVAIDVGAGGAAGCAGSGSCLPSARADDGGQPIAVAHQAAGMVFIGGVPRKRATNRFAGLL